MPTPFEESNAIGRVSGRVGELQAGERLTVLAFGCIWPKKGAGGARNPGWEKSDKSTDFTTLEPPVYLKFSGFAAFQEWGTAPPIPKD